MIILFPEVIIKVSDISKLWQIEDLWIDSWDPDDAFYDNGSISLWKSNAWRSAVGYLFENLQFQMI